MAAIKPSLIFLIAFAVTIPCLQAGIGEYDDFLRLQAHEAHEAALASYVSDPLNVTGEFNAHVHRVLDGTNSTRRNLKKYKGPCVATNPIDRCWRCNSRWESDRKKLATCAQGFGRNARGGAAGRIYVVTDPSDNDMVNPKPGTLRHAVIQKEPLWIIFSHSMIIRLQQELLMAGDKTIDARGANVHIAYGAGITIQFVRNVILHGLHIHDIVPKEGGLIRDSVDHIGTRTRSDGDGISIFGASNIWIDHISMFNCADGLIDVIQASTAITISNCHLTHHNDVMLFGASDLFEGDKIMQITVAFNHFGKGLVQRMPRCRWGFFHVVNNDYTHWLMYAIGGSSHPTIISEGNRFIAPNNPAAKEIVHRDYAPESEWRNWRWTTSMDLLMNGATFLPSGAPFAKKPFSKFYLITAKPGQYVTRLTRFAGSLNCVAGKPC
ncbi:Pectate lyase [Quillaja saponaria]|uniref:Pectate lyase n=1 Tax=Quillaja saponaria TaxID=32244 RepID=A0AAD7PXF5_QUISA|nr:Pectate lyase [Quillaja saponaria]